MKKIIVLALAVLFVSSCKKKLDWDCACEITPTGGIKRLEKTKFEKTVKSSAESNCEAFGKAELKGDPGVYRCRIQEEPG